MTSLNFDFSRCIGVGFADDEVPSTIDWREGCDDCLRRTTPCAKPNQKLIDPPSIIVFECEFYISPEDYKA